MIKIQLFIYIYISIFCLVAQSKEIICQNTNADWNNPASWTSRTIPGVDDDVYLKNCELKINNNESFIVKSVNSNKESSLIIEGALFAEIYYMNFGKLSINRGKIICGSFDNYNLLALKESIIEITKTRDSFVLKNTGKMNISENSVLKLSSALDVVSLGQISLINSAINCHGIMNDTSKYIEIFVSGISNITCELNTMFSPGSISIDTDSTLNIASLLTGRKSKLSFSYGSLINADSVELYGKLDAYIIHQIL